MKRPFDGAAAKGALRADARARRDALPGFAREIASAELVRRTIGLAETLKPSVVAGYRAIRSEFDPAPVLDWALAGNRVVALPAVIDALTIVFRRYRADDPLKPGAFGTAAPGPSAPEMDPDLIIVPLIAFDRNGTRLGHGRGFYDRAIWRLRARGVTPALVGVAFSVQEVAAIPAEPHDVSMDWIVTEREVIDARHLG